VAVAFDQVCGSNGWNANPRTVDEYIAAFTPDRQAALQKMRQAVVPDAEEAISYRIPAFKLNGILDYVAAFEKPIGFYPPVRGDVDLIRTVEPYAGPKGNSHLKAHPLGIDPTHRKGSCIGKQAICRIQRAASLSLNDGFKAGSSGLRPSLVDRLRF